MLDWINSWIGDGKCRPEEDDNDTRDVIRNDTAPAAEQRFINKVLDSSEFYEEEFREMEAGVNVLREMISNKTSLD